MILTMFLTYWRGEIVVLGRNQAMRMLLEKAIR